MRTFADAAMNAEMLAADNHPELPFELKDSASASSVRGRVVAGLFGVEIFVDGYGLNEMQPGGGGVIFIEYFSNQLRVIAWPDIQSAETETVTLDNALEEFRLPNEEQ